jgi:hypothetical protein
MYISYADRRLGVIQLYACPFQPYYHIPGRNAVIYQNITGNPQNMIYKNGVYTQRQVDLMNLMRVLWEQHGFWTRSAINSIVLDSPYVDLVLKRLLRNPKDFEDALRPFYGNELASEFNRLLTEHLVVAADLVKAAKAGDDRKAAEAERKWYKNADDIAAFLGRINPYWSEEEWRRMLYEHLGLVKDEAVTILNKDYQANIDVFDMIEAQALEMADTLSRGIILQFGLI